MSKAVLISIQPKWCELIASGKKTIEVRKTKPKIPTPFKCYIYETKAIYKPSRSPCLFQGRGKVIGEFACDGILSRCEMANADIAEQQGCIKREDLIRYACGKELYGWHISDIKIYDKPKELCEFRKPIDCHRGNEKHQCIGCWDCEIKRPPQSWCYVEILEGEQ